MPSIRASRGWGGKRPTAVIMHDEWYGHRTVSGREIGDKDEWIDWDYALANAFQTIEDYTDQYGLLAWELADERVEVNANRKTPKFKAAIDRATSGKNYKALPGEYYVPEVFSRDREGRIQTFEEWILAEAEKNDPVE